MSQDYEIMIKIPFKAYDTPGARLEAREIIAGIELLEDYPDAVVKVRYLEKGKEPVGIEMGE